MFKNQASQKIALFAFTTATGAPKTGDAANLTPYITKDGGSVTALTDTSATEMSATNAPGWYLFDVSQSESNADWLLFTGKSSTADVAVVGASVYTRPNRFTTMVIDAAGLVDANTVKLGPTGSGTAQTARDIGASVLLSVGTGTGQVNLSSGNVPIRTGIKKNAGIANFPFVMKDDTGAPLTGSTVTVYRSLDGALSFTSVGTATEMASGWYQIDLAAGDTNGDTIALRMVGSGGSGTPADNGVTIVTEP